MNKREAQRIADEDETPYAVYSTRGGGAALVHVTGYRNARIVRGNKGGAVILTASEVARIHEGWRPDMKASG